MFFNASGFVFSQNSLLEFSQSKQKFGKVPEGQDVHLNYEFTNLAEKPLIINEAKVNCTCTIVTYPKEPISPGSKATIKVDFHTAGKIGYQERTVELITNQGNAEILFKGVVKASAETKEEYKNNR